MGIMLVLGMVMASVFVVRSGGRRRRVGGRGRRRGGGGGVRLRMLE